MATELQAVNQPRRLPRPDTPARWQAALRRALAEGVEIRQLAGCGMWIATSTSEAGTAYEVTPWSCECHAGQFGDPVCKHRAAFRYVLGVLTLDPEPGPPTPIALRQPERPCADCHGDGW